MGYGITSKDRLRNVYMKYFAFLMLPPKHMYVCIMYVCAWSYVPMYVYIYVCQYLSSLNACMHLCMYVFVYAQTYLSV